MRNSSIELLRIISVILILLIHIASMGKTQVLFSINYYIIEFFNSIGNTGVTIFILIAGYFGIKLKWNKLIHLILLTTGYGIITYLLLSTTPDYSLNLISFFKALFVVPLYNNWFITCYLLTMLLAPFIDIFVSALTQKQYKQLLIILFIVLSILPTIFNTPYYTVLTAGGKSLVYFLFIYILGRYIGLYNFNISRNKALIYFILSTIVINSLNISATYLLRKPVLIYSMDCSPFILISAISIFNIFKNTHIDSKIINFLSTSVIAVYLLDGMRIYWNYKIFNIENYNNTNMFLIILILEVLFCFIVSIMIDKVRILLLSKIENKIVTFIENYFSKIYRNTKLKLLR